MGLLLGHCLLCLSCAVVSSLFGEEGIWCLLLGLGVLCGVSVVIGLGLATPAAWQSDKDREEQRGKEDAIWEQKADQGGVMGRQR